MDVYLNFDGVLHPDHVFYEDGCRPLLLTPGHTALEFAELLAMTLEGYKNVVIILNTWWTYYVGPDACWSGPLNLRTQSPTYNNG